MLGEILTNYTFFFSLILIRYIGLFLITPFYGSRVIPIKVKVGLAFILAVITFPVLKELYTIQFPDHEIIILFDIIRELAIGFTIGFLVLIVFSAIQLAGQFIDMRMGFMMANVVDPMRGVTSPLIGQFKNLLATLVFLSINGHYIILRLLFKSFKIIPLGKAVIGNQGWEVIIRKSGDIFLIAFQISLPIIGTIFVIDVILGFLARTVPQMNIFIVGFPLKIVVGFVVFMLALHSIVYFYTDLFQNMFQDIDKFINLLHSG